MCVCFHLFFVSFGGSNFSLLDRFCFLIWPVLFLYLTVFVPLFDQFCSFIWPFLFLYLTFFLLFDRLLLYLTVFVPLFDRLFLYLSSCSFAWSVLFLNLTSSLPLFDRFCSFVWSVLFPYLTDSILYLTDSVPSRICSFPDLLTFLRSLFPFVPLSVDLPLFHFRYLGSSAVCGFYLALRWHSVGIPCWLCDRSLADIFPLVFCWVLLRSLRSLSRWLCARSLAVIFP